MRVLALPTRRDATLVVSAAWRDDIIMAATADNVERINLSDQDVAYLVGRNGATRQRLEAFSGCRLNIDRDCAEVEGSPESRELAKLAIKITLQQRSGGVINVNFDDIELREDVSTFDVPKDTVGFLLGKQGFTLRQMETKYRVFMFFNNDRLRQGKHGECKRLYVIGRRQNREDALDEAEDVVRYKLTGESRNGSRPPPRGPAPGGPPPPRYDDREPRYDDRDRGPPPPRYDDRRYDEPRGRYADERDRGPPPPRYDDREPRYDDRDRGPPPPRYDDRRYDEPRGRYADEHDRDRGPPPPRYERERDYPPPRPFDERGPPPPRYDDRGPPSRGYD